MISIIDSEHSLGLYENPLIENVVVVCRFNQARSVIAEAFIREFFPKIRVSSAGIQANSGQGIPKSVVDYANSIGVKIGTKMSRNMLDSSLELQSSDLVLVAEEKFASAVIPLVRQSCRILSLQDSRLPSWIIPSDPIKNKSTSPDLDLELAKTVAATSLILNDLLRRTELNILLVVPSSENSVEKAYNHFLDKIEEYNCIGLDLGFRNSRSTRSLKYNYIKLDYKQKVLETRLITKNTIIKMTPEPISSDRYFLSNLWRNVLSNFGSLPLVMITEPIPTSSDSALDLFHCLSPLSLGDIRSWDVI